MEIVNIGFAFSAGLLAVLAPCSLPLLPTFFSYFLGLEGKNNLKSAISFGLTTAAGFLSIFLIIGILPSFIINILSSKVKLFSPLIGIILIISGLGSLLTNIFSNVPVIKTVDFRGTGYKAFYLYGIAYGAASLTCNFPVFIMLVMQSANLGGFVPIFLMFIAYGIGSASIFIPLSFALTYGLIIIHHRLITLLPYVKKINALVLIFAGVYMIYY